MEVDFNIKRSSLPEIIADKLELMILNKSGELEHKLPSEQSLADCFSVSRPVIREAMKILKTRGLVEQKNGEGTFISEFEPSVITDAINRYVLSKNIDVPKIFAVRISLETMTAGLAAQNASNNDIMELDEINQQMEKDKSNLEKRAEYDILFHKKIAHISGNPLLEIFIVSMAGLVTPVVRHTLMSYGNEEGIISHKKIIEVLKKGEPEKAENVMREHLINSMHNYERANIQTIYNT